MASNEDLKKTLQTAPMPPEWQQRFLALLPGLGQTTLQFLQNELFTAGSELVLKYLIPSLEKAFEATKSLRSGQAQAWMQLAQGYEDDQASDFGRYYLGPILDAKRMFKAGTLPYDLELAWIGLELKYADELPQEEYVAINGENILAALAHSNYLMLLKKFYLDRIPKKSMWPDQMVRALLQNEESIGEKPISLNGKQVPPLVKNWLADFSTNAVKTATTSATFEEIQYIKQSPNVGLLDPKEQKLLMAVIKVYSWCKNPVATREEIEKLELENRTALPAVPDAFSPPRPKLAPPQVPAPKPKAPESLLPSFPPPPKPPQPDAIMNPYNKGLRITGPGMPHFNMDVIKADMDKKRREKEGSIDRRLEELKKKAKSN